MILSLYRTNLSTSGKCIIGKLFINGVYECDTLEPLYEDVYSCIPCGTYRINLTTVSSKFHNKSPYKTLCNGCPPRLVNVPNRDGILIHVGNTKADTSGCILLGKNEEKGKLLHSLDTFTKFYKKLDKSEPTFIEVSNVPCDYTSLEYFRKLPPF